MTQEPEWIDMTTFGSDYQVELDVCSPHGQQRYRRRPFTGESVEDWTLGSPPQD